MNPTLDSIQDQLRHIKTMLENNRIIDAYGSIDTVMTSLVIFETKLRDWMAKK